MARTPETKAMIANIQAQENRERARRIAVLKHGLGAAEFRNDEIAALEDVVFRAFGRTKLKR